jgi:molybdenum cofactor synthesis domain-containing protein
VKTISVLEAEGMVLLHDISEIVPGKFKGRAFKKGHVVRREDISKLLDLGKEHLFVMELNEKMLHENDAAMRMAVAAAGPGIRLTEPVEGKVELKSEIDGLLKITVPALEAVNDIDQIVFASIHSNRMVRTGMTLAGCRVVPLVIEAEKIEKVEAICKSSYPLFEVKPLRSLNVGIITTGSEVYQGRIQDKFGPVLTEKILGLGSRVMRQIFVSDSIALIVEAINSLLRDGAEMILITGGMSVDPDDVTPAGIRAAGGRVVAYGAPVLPGSMFMLAHLGSVPVLGLPGCVMYHKTTIFDLLLPRILAGDEITRKDIIRLCHGGLCSVCNPCKYPDCAFGKSS